MYLMRRPWYRAVALPNGILSSYATSSRPKLEEQTWNFTIAEAEKVVGYPTSFLNLRWLLSDEVANVASHLRKLLGTNHPLLSMAKDLILNNEKPSWGLMILLVSKAGGHNKTFSDVDKDLTAGVLHSQRILAEVAEMIKTSHLLHKGQITIEENTDNMLNMKFGNKIALLCGDYLLSNSYRQLAYLKNHDVDEIMSSALRDLVENEFLGPRDKHNQPLPSKPSPKRKDIQIPDDFGITPSDIKDFLGNAKAEWTLRNTLGGASLLGKSCQSVLLLAGHGEDFQRCGYLFGKYLALSLRATREYNSIFTSKDFSIVSAPILFHLQRYPDFYSEFEHLIDADGEIDKNIIRTTLKQSPALNDTILLQNELCNTTLNILNGFKDSDAKNALKNIIRSVKL